jgi:Helix-turn-helix.
MVIKEIRLERGVHQGIIAKNIGKTPNAWTKIENGQSNLSFDVLTGACIALQVDPALLMNTISKMIPYFHNAGFFLHHGSLSQEEDDLLPLMLKYFNSSGYEYFKSRPYERISLSRLNEPFASHTVIPTVIKYCIDSDYKEWIDQGAQGIP